MKKIIALLLAILLCVTFSACKKNFEGDIEAITDELNGSAWTNKVDDENYTKWTFYNSLVEAETTSLGITLKADRGKFTVQDNLIILTWDNSDCGRVKELYYAIENNQLKLYSDSDKTYELECIEKNKDYDISETAATTSKSILNRISKEKAIYIAEQRIKDMCCNRANTSTISIDIGTFTVSETSIGDYRFKVQGTYLPKDNYGMYGSRMKFDMEICVDQYYGKVTVLREIYKSAY